MSLGCFTTSHSSVSGPDALGRQAEDAAKLAHAWHLRQLRNVMHEMDDPYFCPEVCIPPVRSSRTGSGAPMFDC
jgi:hypothetical protein